MSHPPSRAPLRALAAVPLLFAAQALQAQELTLGEALSRAAGSDPTIAANAAQLQAYGWSLGLILQLAVPLDTAAMVRLRLSLKTMPTKIMVSLRSRKLH